MKREELKKIIQWVEARLAFVDKLIDEAQSTRNYGKEMHFTAQKEVYVEMLNKLQSAEA
jgi:acyl-homoserine lactone acylase PvdQ